jgi:N-methylhydantoinase B
MFENQNPVHLRKHELMQDSAGPGQWRGGSGTETEIVIEGDNVAGVVFGDGIEEEAKAFGLFGGGSGIKNKMNFATPDNSEHTPKSKEIVKNIATYTVLTQIAGGGGGYGDPFERPTKIVQREAVNGLVSIEGARQYYGVVIDQESLELDQESTDALRGVIR